VTLRDEESLNRKLNKNMRNIKICISGIV